MDETHELHTDDEGRPERPASSPDNIWARPPAAPDEATSGAAWSPPPPPPLWGPAGGGASEAEADPRWGSGGAWAQPDAWADSSGFGPSAPGPGQTPSGPGSAPSGPGSGRAPVGGSGDGWSSGDRWSGDTWPGHRGYDGYAGSGPDEHPAGGSYDRYPPGPPYAQGGYPGASYGSPPPPGGGYGAGSDWSGSGGWVPPWVTETRPPRRRSLPAIVVALLLVAAGLAGLAIGHNVWHQSGTGTPTGNGGFNNGNGFPFGGNGGNGSGSNGGGSRFGSGGTIPGSTGNGSTGGNGPSDASSIAAKVAPALVDIDTALSYAGGEAAGTGIVLTADGIVLTNNHVISGSTRITATDVGNRQQYSATVVGYDRTHDIAVIKLKNASGLATASIADSSAVRVGDQVVGVGNAGGLGGTPSNAGGTVTALDQAITATDESDNSSEQLTGLIQVDADIQPGDSGGALVNAKSQVIGIDTAASQGFSFQTTSGQGFAIPINQGREISDQIRAGQASELVHIGPTAFLGVLVDVSSSGSAPTSGVPGAVLKDVVPQAPAAEAGLTQGDVITSLGGHAITSSSGLTAALVRYHPGDKVQLQWVDDAGQSHSTTIRLATGPAA